MTVDNNILDVSEALDEWLQAVTIKTVTKATVDFEPNNTVVARSQECVVQVAEKEKLNPDTIDWSKEYIMVHSKSAIEISELVEYYSEDFIVTEKAPYRGYGFYEVIAVQTKKPVVSAT
jgi:hypothetical protein